MSSVGSGRGVDGDQDARAVASGAVEEAEAEVAGGAFRSLVVKPEEDVGVEVEETRKPG